MAAKKNPVSQTASMSASRHVSATATATASQPVKRLYAEFLPK